MSLWPVYRLFTACLQPVYSTIPAQAAGMVTRIQEPPSDAGAESLFCPRQRRSSVPFPSAVLLFWTCGPNEHVGLSCLTPSCIPQQTWDLPRPRYLNGSLQTARLRHHMTSSPFGSPSCGVSHGSALAPVLPDSWDEVCNSKTGNLS